MASALVRELIDSGVHFGHRASRWNPKMAPHIFGKRNSIHIIDIRQTVKGLLRAKKFLAALVSQGHDVLIVGTKRQEASGRPSGEESQRKPRVHEGAPDMATVIEQAQEYMATHAIDAWLLYDYLGMNPTLYDVAAPK